MLRAFVDRLTSALGGRRPKSGPGDATIIARVAVAYKSDPEHVQSVLLGVASRCAMLASEPKPFVILDELGPSALEFSLRGTAARPYDGLKVASELRLAILKAFREAGIEIALPQQDVHLRDLDFVRALIARLAEERARAAASTVDTTSETAPASPPQARPFRQSSL